MITPKGAPGEHADDEQQGAYAFVEELGRDDPVEPCLQLVDMGPLQGYAQREQGANEGHCLRPDQNTCPYGITDATDPPKEFLYFSGPELQTGARFQIASTQPIFDSQLTPKMQGALENGDGMLGYTTEALAKWKELMNFAAMSHQEFAQETREIIEQATGNPDIQKACAICRAAHFAFATETRRREIESTA
ncbi:hypothetical protein HN748_03760 [Candidatus Peregrinibacteria bacterium]|nr:hypothetical protein [Candidatus Peregrinibacteria bacterium]